MIPKPQPKHVEGRTVEEFLEASGGELKLKLVAGSEGLQRTIRDKTLNRPALALTGYMKYFGFKRVQLFGAGEMGYLRDLDEAGQARVLRLIFEKQIPCVVVSRNLAPPKAMIAAAERMGVPLLRTPMSTRDFAGSANILLEHLFAPSISEHGTMLDIQGVGVLLRGESGVGKSECALALIDRGFSLVADDTVRLKLLNEKELMATSSELNRGYMECRGLGIINIAELFGIRAIRLEKQLDLVVTFTVWVPGAEESRTGLEENFYELLGQSVPHITFHVRPGRDLAQLVEAAAMVQALKAAGHNPALEFNQRLIEHMAGGDPEPPAPGAP